MKKLSLILVLSFIVSVLGFQSCTDESATSQAPELPTPQMMLMDFNGFEKADPDSRSISNWFHAAVNVLFFTGTVVDGVAVPVTAFVTALHQDAVYQGNNTWMWTFTVAENGEEYIVELYGSLDMTDAEVDWNMYVTKTGVFTNFEWVTGSTAYDQSYSNFLLNGFADEEAGNYSPVEFLQIDYSKENNAYDEGIRYTLLLPEDPNMGSYIQYGRTASNADYPVFYDVYLSEVNNLTNIEVNPETNAGRVKDPRRFHDENWHCWDEFLRDIDCSL